MINGHVGSHKVGKEGSQQVEMAYAIVELAMWVCSSLLRHLNGRVLHLSRPNMQVLSLLPASPTLLKILDSSWSMIIFYSRGNHQVQGNREH